MNEYSLTRDDFDTILELATWPGSVNPETLIPSTVKSAFTRAYNKQAHKNPFSIVDVKKLKAVKVNEEEMGENGYEERVESSDDEEKDDVNKDAMIKVKTKTKAAASKPKKAVAVKRGNKTSNDDDTKANPKKKKKISYPEQNEEFYFCIM